MEHQEEFCLAETFQSCPVFQANGKVVLAKDSREPDEALQMRTRFWIVRGAIIVAVLVAIILIFQNWNTIIAWLEPQAAVVQANATYVAPTYLAENPTSGDDYQPGLLPTIVKQNQASDTPPVVEITPVNTEDEIYVGKGLVIHRVIKGESLDQLSDKFYTVPQAILDINYGLKPPIIIDQTIVIPEGFIDTKSLPQFETKYIKEKTKVGSIVKKYSCNLDLFRKYNRQLLITSVDTEYILGESWVVIPRERAAKKP